MGPRTLSESEAVQATVIQQYLDGKLTVDEVCDRLGCHRATLFRKVSRFRAEGPYGLVHRLRGRSPNNRASEEIRKAVCELYAKQFAPYGFGVEHFYQHAVSSFPGQVSYSTVWRWLRQAKLIEPLRRTRKHRSRRLRKEAFGEMLQMDTSIHDWLGWGNNQALIATMDDATSVLCGAELTESDTTFGNMRVLKQAFVRYGIPVSLYTDRSPIFRVTRTGYGKVLPPKFKSPYITHVQRAMTDLKVRLIFAGTPQAKGRIERSFGTWQKRLIPELRKAGIRELSKANAYIREVYIPQFNERFATDPSTVRSAFVPLPDFHIDRALTVRHTLKVPNDHVLLSRGADISLRILPSENRISYAKASVDVLKHPDGRVTVLHNGIELKTQTFSPSR
jgi:transposase